MQGELEAALVGLFGVPVRTTFAGRTDRGVHATGQVVGCSDHRPELAEDRIRRALNVRLPADLAIIAVERRPPGFHARYDAIWREYRYRIWCGDRQPLAQRWVWERHAELDARAMDAAAARLVGAHDFAALAGGGEGLPWSDRRSRPRGTVRAMLRCDCRPIPPWWGARPEDGELIELRVVADGFLPQMVRNMAAVLVEVGRGARRPEWVEELLAARDRRAGAGTAPAHGLTLWRIGYGTDKPEPDPGEGPGPRAAPAV